VTFIKLVKLCPAGLWGFLGVDCVPTTVWCRYGRREIFQITSLGAARPFPAPRSAADADVQESPEDMGPLESLGSCFHLAVG